MEWFWRFARFSDEGLHTSLNPSGLLDGFWGFGPIPAEELRRDEVREAIKDAQDKIDARRAILSAAELRKFDGLSKDLNAYYLVPKKEVEGYKKMSKDEKKARERRARQLRREGKLGTHARLAADNHSSFPFFDKAGS